MRRVSAILVVFMVGVAFSLPGWVFAEEQKNKALNERIIEILIENKVITKEQYEELKRLAQGEAQKETASKPTAVAGYDRGFYIESADKQSKVRFDGRFHGDFKGYIGSHPDDSSFFIRRARLAASGTFYKYYDFRVEYEAGKGSDARLNDGFMNIHYWPQAQFKYGQFKVPFSMEELQSDNWINYVERSLANKSVPSRDIGIMLHGDLGDQLLYYQLGLFNGYKLNQPSDADSGKDAALRLVLSPFKGSNLNAVKGLRLGGSLTYGREELDASQWWNSGKWRTAADTTYLAMKSAVKQDGHRTRSGLELCWDLGSTQLMAEYMYLFLDGLELGNDDGNFDIKGGYISLSHFLTGEKFRFKNGIPGRVVPVRRFTPGGEGWGAFQIGGRLEFVDADDELFDRGYVDPAQNTKRAIGYTLGLNWYPNEMVRLMLNYNHVDFDDPIRIGDDRIDSEDVVLTRFQTVF